MTKDGASINEDNYISVDEEKLKEDQKAELAGMVEKFKCECLKSYSTTMFGDVVKKFDFPTIQPLTEVQLENQMLDMVHHVVGHAFISHSPVMTNTVHNAVVKTLGRTCSKVIQDHVICSLVR